MSTVEKSQNVIAENDLIALINEVVVAAHACSIAIASNREEGQHLVVLPLLEANKLVSVYQRLEGLPGPEGMNGGERLVHWIKLHQAARDQAIADRLAHEASLTPYQRFTDILSTMGVRWHRNETNEDGDQSIGIDGDEVGNGCFINATFDHSGEFKQFDVYEPSQVLDSADSAEPNTVSTN